MQLRLNEIVPESVIKNLNEMIQRLDSGNDIRLSLSLLAPIAYVFRGLIDIYDDPDMRFLSYLLVDQFGNIQGTYDGRSEKWYELNQANVENLRKILSAYCKGILESIRTNNITQFINATRDFFAEFHEIARERTLDVRRD